MYTDEGGVHEAMATFGLPATVKDCHGWSVLHYAASMRFADDSPVWELRDIKKYVEQHRPFPNAVDHWGAFPACGAKALETQTLIRNKDTDIEVFRYLIFELFMHLIDL